jgi:hypothetical protein
MSSEKETFQKFLRGLIKVVLAPVIITIINAIPLPSTLTVGNNTVDVSAFVSVLLFMIPFLLIFSALKDFGVRE